MERAFWAYDADATVTGKLPAASLWGAFDVANRMLKLDKDEIKDIKEATERITAEDAKKDEDEDDDDDLGDPMGDDEAGVIMWREFSLGLSGLLRALYKEKKVRSSNLKLLALKLLQPHKCGRHASHSNNPVTRFPPLLCFCIPGVLLR